MEDAKSKAEEVENFVFFLGVMTNIRVHVQLKRKHAINVRRKDILLEDVGVKLQNWGALWMVWLIPLFP